MVYVHHKPLPMLVFTLDSHLRKVISIDPSSLPQISINFETGSWLLSELEFLPWYYFHLTTEYQLDISSHDTFN